jgi:hypothetical protein
MDFVPFIQEALGAHSAAMLIANGAALILAYFLVKALFAESIPSIVMEKPDSKEITQIHAFLSHSLHLSYPPSLNHHIL